MIIIYQLQSVKIDLEGMMILLTRLQKVQLASRYYIGYDNRAKAYRIMNQYGFAYDGAFSTREIAEKHAIQVAKMAFVKKNKSIEMDKVRLVLGNDVIDEIGEENLLDGPLYERDGNKNTENDLD